MTSGSNFWDGEVWSFVLTLTILLVAMMAANCLRRLIKPLRQALIPSSVVGGFLVLFADFIFKEITGNPMLETSTLEALTYHGLGLGFVAMTLRQTEKPSDKHKKSDVLNTGLTTVVTYLQQAIIGLAITIGLYYLLGSFSASGLLLPLGYGQGPGQAYSWGHTYEATYGFTNGTSFGLAVAAMGFISSSVGGVIYLNIMRRKGRINRELGEDFVEENLSAETITGKDEIPLSESLDKLTVQIALVFIAYVLAYGFMYAITAVVNTGILGNFGYNTLLPLVWGFNFLFGVLFAILVKNVLIRCKKKGWIKREYTNNFIQTRISGFMFDVMVVASIAAIDLSAFTHTEFVLPLLAICVAGGVITYFQVQHIAKTLFPDYTDEFFLAMYGMLTGTASTGVILLREADPHYDTPAANNLVYQNLWAIIFGFPMLLLLAVAPKSIAKSWLTLGLLAALIIAMYIILFRSRIFKKKSGK